MSATVTIPLKVIAENLEVDIDCTVLEVKGSQLGGAKPGMVVTSIQGTTISDRTELKNEMAALQASGGSELQVTIVFNTPAAAEDDVVKKVKKTGGDELDFSSDDEGGAQAPVPNAPPAHYKTESGDQVILNAVQKTPPGGCVLLLCDRYNPAFQVERAAQSLQITVMHIDAVTRVKSRLPMQEFGGTMRKSLERGVWMYIENASKSITLLNKLAESIYEVREAKKMHKDSRVLLLCEPHPHFPQELLEGAVTLRMRMTNEQPQLEETFKDPRAKLQLMKGGAKPAEPEQPKTSTKKRTVRIASEVDVVALETSTFLEMSASAAPPTLGENGQGKEGLSRIAKYRFGPNEKLI